MPLPIDKQPLIDQILAVLTPIPGVQAVVLGGSHARGTARPDSDLDIGIYYSETAPFAISDILSAARKLSQDPGQEVTDFYGWGAWVNGGGWIHAPACKIDFLYRNLEQVQRTILDAQQGITHHDFDQQPAYGFYSVIYLAETSICIPLYDPHSVLARLKAQVEVYPPLLKEKAVMNNLWMAEFSLLHAEGFSESRNFYAVIGAIVRAASFLTQALFALNEIYFLSDKTALSEMKAFKVSPAGYTENLTEILGHLGQTIEETEASVKAMRELWAGVVALTHGAYKPAFRL